MKLLFTLFVLILAASDLAVARQASADMPRLTGPYLGQKLPGMTAEVFAPGVVSTDSLEHSKISFAQDGSAFFWAAQPSLSTNIFQQRIWFVEKNAGVWSKPAELNIPQVALATPTLSLDGKELFYTGSENSSTEDLNQRVKEFFVLDLASKKIENISRQFPALRDCWSFSMAGNGDIYFDHSGKNAWEISVLRKQNGKYMPPEKLPAEINDGSQNIHPFISPDGKYLLFSSSRPGGYGSADLYASFKDKNGQWTIVKNLGNAINSDWRERFPSVANDGQYLFFTRRNDESNDFFWVDAKIIEALKPKE
ncbi:MAG: hypothetical protein WCL37_00675 [Chrysiogenales bacterium]